LFITLTLFILTRERSLAGY